MSRFVGSGVINFPAPNEKSKINPGGKITGTTSGGSITKSHPLSASFDSRPLPGDNKRGATRPGGGKAAGGSVGSGGYMKKGAGSLSLR